jgi:hypothetical protein
MKEIWTEVEIKQDLRDWHEKIIAQYEPKIQYELRTAMTKFLAGWKRKR